MNPLVNYFQHYCCWKYDSEIRSNGKRAKKPINPNTGGLASVSDSDDWGTFAQAQARFDHGGYEGNGALLEDSDLTVVDIDGLDWLPGYMANSIVPEDEAELITWLNRFEGLAYIEMSPSGKGLHIFFSGNKPEGCRNRAGRYEIYDSSDRRYITLTGQQFGSEVQTLAEGGEVLQKFCEWSGLLKHRGEGEPCMSAVVDCNNTIGEPENLTADDVLKLLKQRNKRGKIIHLIAGEWQERYMSQSDADLAMMAEIAFYTADMDLLIEVFKRTALADTLKRKGSSKHQADYLIRTAKRALDSVCNSYWEQQARRIENNAAETRIADGINGKLQDGGIGLQRHGRRIITSISNIEVLLTQWLPVAGVFAYNEFSGEVEKLAGLPSDVDPSGRNKAGPLNDNDLVLLRSALSREFGVDFRKADVDDALVAVAMHRAYNPLQDVLDALRWDGVSRLDNWLVDYLGVDPAEDGPAYTAAVGAKTLIAAVARAYQPGCKADHMLVLEGAQGCGKSSAVAILGKAIYSDSFREGIPALGDRGSTEAQKSLKGAWIVELSEMAGFSRAEAAHIKAFISETHDHYRKPYARKSVNEPRTVVFLGTINVDGDGWIMDGTGGRRFWPVVCGKVRLDKLAADVQQLWAEAVVRYKAGEFWYLVEERENAEAVAAQMRRSSSDAWMELVVSFLKTAEGAHPLGFTMLAVWRFIVKSQHQDDQFSKTHQHRVASILRQLGYKKRSSNGVNLWWRG